MKKLFAYIAFTAFLLCHTVAAKAATVSVSITTDQYFTDGQTIISTMQDNLGRLLTEINNANEQNRNLNMAGMPLDDFAKSTLVMLWNNIHFYCDDDEVVDRCWPLQNGYMMRQIPLIMNPQGEAFGHGNYQEATVMFDKRGRITDFSFVFDSQVGESMERCAAGGGRVQEMERRLIIKHWMDRLSTAYNSKNIAFLQRVFSDSALIITGNVVTTTTLEGGLARKVTYKKQNKQQYMANLQRAFARNKFIQVTFSEIGMGGVEGGACDGITRSANNPNWYGVRMHQAWRSSNYSDDGYVFLLWDFTNEEKPLIHVRTWQPEFLDKAKTQRIDPEEIFSLSDFDNDAL